MVVAISILFIVMVSLAYIVTNGLTDVAFGKQRQVATSLMNKTMEEIRALPFAQVAAGLSVPDMADPEFIQPVGPLASRVYKFIPNGELIPHYSSGTGNKPLYPHRSTKVLNGTTYTIGVYPTYTFPAGVFRVTVTVSWNKTLETGLVSRVTSQSLVYSPEGCLSRTTHPFGAPCQAFLYANAALGSGFFRVSPAGAGNGILGLPLRRAEFSLPTASSSVQIEQISSMLSSVQSAAALLDVAGEALQRSGGKSTSASADNDPSAATASAASSNDLPIQDDTLLADASATGNRISVEPTSTDTGSSTSTASADGSPSCEPLAGPPVNTNLPCASGTVRASGSAMAALLELHAGTTNLGTATLGSVSSATDPSRVSTSRHTSSGTGMCAGASGDGCIHAGSARNIGAMRFAGLPPALLPSAPTGWDIGTNFLFQLDDYSDELRAESGVGASAPTASIPAAGASTPRMTYWNGAGYTTLALNSPASQSIVINPVEVTHITASGDVTASMSAQIDIAAPTTSLATPAGCASTCSASATSSSAITATVMYSVRWAGEALPLADLVLTLDLGTMLAKASYKAPPSAG